MEIVESLNPTGKTPLAQAVEKAAEVLDFKTKPGTVIVLTDGEETCGGAPCDLGKMLAAEALSGHQDRPHEQRHSSG